MNTLNKCLKTVISIPQKLYEMISEDLQYMLDMYALHFLRCFLELFWSFWSQNDSLKIQLKISKISKNFSTVVNLRMQTDVFSPVLNVVTVGELLISFGNQIVHLHLPNMECCSHCC